MNDCLSFSCVCIYLPDFAIKVPANWGPFVRLIGEVIIAVNFEYSADVAVFAAEVWIFRLSLN